MATELFANTPSTTVSSGGTTAPSSGTVETWTVASSALFPSASAGLGTQFHVADPAFPRELVAVTNVSGSTWTVTRGAESTTPVAHTAGFTIYQVVSAGWLGSVTVTPAWQFRPESYGAVGDGKVVTDVVTNGTKVITSASAGFVNATAPAGDVGKWVLINGGNGSAAGPYIDVIASVQSATQATLTTNSAGASATSCQMVWGTDDTTAINNCITAGANFALGTSGSGAGFGNYLFEVVFDSKIYITAGLTQSSSPAIYNTQIPVPYPAQNGLSRKLMVTLRGAGEAAALQYWESTAPNIQGTAIVSMLTAPSSQDPTFLQQSVIGGPSGASGFTGGFANTNLTVRNLSVWCGAYTNIKALDMTILSGCDLDGYSSNIAAPANNLSSAAAAHPYLDELTAQGSFQGTHGVGIVFPAGQNNDNVVFGSIAVEGYEVGISGQDHLTGVRYAGLYTDVVMSVSGGGSVHEVAIQSVSAEVYNGGILVTGSAGHNVRLNIGWDSEASGPLYDISDTGNNAYGVVRFYDLNHAPPVVTGAANLKVINDRLGPGHWSGAPAVPASGSAVAQSAMPWRDAWVTVHQGAAGTVTAITVDGTATGLTVQPSSTTAARVPSGKTIALTNSGTVTTWDWWLD